MMKTLRATVAAVAGASVLATALAAVAEPRDLIGARAGQGESSLRSRGYVPDHNDGGVQYWWNAGSSECINLFVDNGRYDTIDRRPTSECNLSRGSSGKKKDNSGAIIAGALAIGILAAAASSKNKNHDDDRYHDHDDGRRNDPPYSPARDVDCYPSQRACYERGRGYSASWTSHEFNYRY